MSKLQKPLYYRGGKSEELALSPYIFIFAPVFTARVAHEIVCVVLAAQGRVVKTVDAVKVRNVVTAILAGAADAYSPYNASQNLVPILLPHGLLKKKPEGRKHAGENDGGGGRRRYRSR
jgi:hypothetical protein